MKAILQDSIKKALASLGIQAEAVVLEHPGELAHGDYSTNVSLAYAKAAGKNPRALAEEIVAELLKDKPGHVETIDIAGPGFINFHFSKDFFAARVKAALDESVRWGASSIYSGRNILVEHSSPNLFKPFHIGHVMNNAIGESISRLARFSGAAVKVISYPSDVSLGIGKAVYVVLKEGGIEKIQSIGGSIETLSYLGDCYVRGTKLYDEDPEAAKEVKRITSVLYEKDLASVEYRTYDVGKEINLAYFKAITSRLGSAFDDFIFESEAGAEGLGLVKANVPQVFTESEGAVIYEGEKDGLHTRVFVNKEGYPTYEAKDIGLMSLKFKRYSPDVSVFVTDHEQQEYFKVVSAAAAKINPVWKEKTVHRTHGRMSFKGQKMSSRLGGVPLAQTLVDTLFGEVSERSDRLDPVADWGAVNAISVAALKFTILRAIAGKNINFDPETSLSFEGDSGPYLQYSAVRAGAILEKAKSEGVSAATEVPSAWGTTTLERLLVRFPDIVEHSIEDWAPHHVVGYLLELAQAFNSWYAGGKIVDPSDASSPYKVALTDAFRVTMKNGLYLLGIEVPEKM